MLHTIINNSTDDKSKELPGLAIALDENEESSFNLIENLLKENGANDMQVAGIVVTLYGMTTELVSMEIVSTFSDLEFQVCMQIKEDEGLDDMTTFFMFDEGYKEKTDKSLVDVANDFAFEVYEVMKKGFDDISKFLEKTKHLDPREIEADFAELYSKIVK